MKKLIVILLMSLLLTGCASEKETFTYQKIDSATALEIMNESGNYQIIDVRTADEYNESHLDNAINIPVDEINEIEIDKDTVLFVYCRSGVRSKVAAETLIDLGYTVYDLGAYESIDLEE